MSGINKLKDEARKHEQREEWDKAIRAYQQVLADAESEEVELPLYNRVGDLYVRIGRREDAVRYYEQAADRYAEAGLYNNAIALCNKALRYVPGRLSVLRRLGQFSASQGFLTDARSYLMQFAEKSFAGGDAEGALSALTDYANLSGDAEVRELIGRKLHALGRTADGISELKRAYALRLGSGEADAAADLRREILRIEPAAFDGEVPGGTQPEMPQALVFPIPADRLPDLPDEPLPALPDEPPSEPPTLQPLGTAFSEIDELEPEGGSPPALLAGFETTAFDTAGTEAADAQELAGLEQASEFEAETPEPATLEGLEQAEEVAEQEVPVLPRIELMEDHLREGRTDLEEGTTSAFELPLLEDQGEGEPEPMPLPLIEDLDTATGVVEEAVADLPSLDSSQAVDDETPLPLLAEPDELEQADLPLLDDQDFPLGEDTTELAAEADIPLMEDLGEESAELALPLIDDTTEDLVETEEQLIGAASDVLPEPDLPLLGDAGDDLGPDLPLLEGAEPIDQLPLLEDEPESPPVELPDYVNLRELLIEEEPRGKDTRFTVAEQVPTGDEDDDFSKLLSQFRRKVSETVAPEDVAAHYDLGLAFKDMGLLDEAISELQVALQAGDMRLKVLEELGLCFFLKKEYGIAEKVLRRALETRHEDELELLGVYYHLGRTCEELGRRDAARDSYERVLGLDINFRDVSERIARL